MFWDYGSTVPHLWVDLTKPNQWGVGGWGRGGGKDQYYRATHIVKPGSCGIFATIVAVVWQMIYASIYLTHI